MFWGITLESGKKYTQVLQKSFCVTMAALGFENPSNDRVYVVAEVNKAQHVLCSLQSGKLPQQVLNLNFTEGEQVSFFIEGEGEVHLTGYLTPEDNDSELSDESSCEEDEKDELKGDAELQNKVVTAIQSNYVHNNHVINDDKVSDVSWQGILSGSQEKDILSDDEEETEGRNGEKHPENRILTKESKEESEESINIDERPSYERKMEARGIPPINTVVSENEKSVLKEEHFNDISNKSALNGDNIPTNEFTNNVSTTNVLEVNCNGNSDNETKPMYSEVSDTKYLLVDKSGPSYNIKTRKRPTRTLEESKKKTNKTSEESKKRARTRNCKKRKCNNRKSVGSK